MPAGIEEKFKRYRDFWNNAPMDRPLIGFSVGGWFPLQHYPGMQRLRNQEKIIPNQLDPEAFFNDYDRIVATFESVGLRSKESSLSSGRCRPAGEGF